MLNYIRTALHPRPLLLTLFLSSQLVPPDVRSFSFAGVGLQIHLATALLYAPF